MRAACITGGLHAKLARGIRRQEVALHHAVLHDVTALRAHTLLIERRAAHATRHVRVFLDLHVRREDFLAQRIEQKGRLAIQRPARHGLHERTQQARRQRRLEQHRALARGQPARGQTRQRTFRSILADGFRRGQIGRRALGRIPVVALHMRTRPGDRRGRNEVARIRITGHETARRSQHEVRMLRRDARAIAVADLRAHGKGSGFGSARDFDCGLRIDHPRVVELQVLRMLLQQLFFGQACAIVIRRETRNVVGSLDRGTQRGRREIRRAGVAALLAQHDRHADDLVAVLLNGLDLALAHRDRQALAFGDFRCGIGGAKLACNAQHIGGHLFELFAAVGKHRGGLGIERLRHRQSKGENGCRDFGKCGRKCPS